MFEAGLIAAGILGLGSGMHCIAMCGPVQWFFLGDRRGIYNRRWWLYHSGRISMYMLWGALVATLMLPVQVGWMTQQLGLLSGIALILYFAMPIRWRHSLEKALDFAGRPIRNGLAPYRQRSLFVAGMINGCLPCGMLVPAMLIASAGQSIVSGVAVMFVFSLGTLPALWLVNRWNPLMRLSRVRVVGMLVGLVLVVRSLGLDIPLMSPEFNLGTTVAHLCGF